MRIKTSFIQNHKEKLIIKRREELCYVECKHACVEALKPFYMYKISKINPCIYGLSLLNIIYLNQVNKVQSN